MGNCRSRVLAAMLLIVVAAIGRGRAQDAEPPRAVVDLPSAEFISAIAGIGFGTLDPGLDLWPLVERCRTEVVRGAQAEEMSADFPTRFACGRVGELLASTAEGSGRERILGLLDSLPADDWLRQPLLEGLLAARVREVLRQPEAPVALASATEPLPSLPIRLRSAPSDLQQAWQLQASLLAAYRGLLERYQGEDAVAFQSHEPQFYEALSDFLRGGSPPERAIAELGRFDWGGWCGTGSERLLAPQGRALMLALTATGDRRAAAGALLASRDPLGEAALPEDWPRQYLKAMGFEWEPLFLGRVLEQATWSAADLARHGSDHSLRLLFAAREIQAYDGSSARLEDEDWYVQTLGGVVTPTDRCSDYATHSSLDVQRADDAEAVAADLQSDILDFLAARVGRGASQREAETAAHVLVRLCRSESLPAFRKMARSPYSEVREAGALGLRSLGEPDPKVRATPPLVVQVTLNGQPAKGLRLRWTLGRSRSDGWLGSDEAATTAADGTLHVDRDPFLDQKERVDRVTLGTNDLGSPEDTWFEMTQPRPLNLAQPLVFRVETQTLTVSCPDAGTQPLALRLEAPSNRWGGIDVFLPIASALALAGRPLTFSQLQRGDYQVSLVSNRGSWTSDVVHLGSEPVTVTCGSFEPFEAERR